MKAFPLLFVSLLSTVVIPSAFAGPEMQTRWIRSYGAPYQPGQPMDGACSLLAASNGDLVTIGTAGGKISVWRHTPFGGLLWSSQETGAGAKGVLDSTGHICAAGTANGDIIVKKLSPSGEVLWHRVWDSPSHETETVADLVTDPDGNIYIAGTSGNSSSRGVSVVKFDSDGRPRWSQRYDDPAGASSACRIVLTPDNDVTVCGTIGGSGARDFLFLRYSADSTFRWKKTWDSPLEADDVLTHVAADAAGNLTLAGNSAQSSTIQTVAVVRMDADANVLWAPLLTYHRPGWTDPGSVLSLNWCGGLSLTPDGKVLISIATMRHTAGRAYYEFGSVASLYATGVTEWQTEVREQYWGAAYPAEERLIGAVIRQPEGGCLVGYSSSWGLTRLKPGGSVDWHAFATGVASPEGGACRAMLLDEGGRLYECLATCNPSSGNGAVTLRKWTDWSEPAIPPAVQTGPPLDIAYNTAKVSGTIEARPFDTLWWFEYGPTLAYSGVTPVSTLPAGAEAVPVDAFLPGLAPNTVYYYRLAATYDGNSIAYGAPVEFITPPSPWQLWTTEKFGVLDAPGALPEDDPDQDGLLNLAEFAFGGNPLQPDKLSSLPQPELYVDPETGNKYLAITYTVNPAAVDLAYTPETAPDPASFNITGVSIQELPGNRRRAVATAGGRFMRVRVALLTP